MKPVIAGLLFCLPLSATAAIINSDPGDVFAMPMPGDAYLWSLNLQDAEIGDVIESFTVQVSPGNRSLKTFQAFGHCDGDSDPWYARFGLSVSNSGGTATTWTELVDGPCAYHNYLDQILDVGDNTFEITYIGADNSVPSDHQTVQFRFGTIMPAIPLPAGLPLMSGALGLLGLVALRRRAG